MILGNIGARNPVLLAAREAFAPFAQEYEWMGGRGGLHRHDAMTLRRIQAVRNHRASRDRDRDVLRAWQFALDSPSGGGRQCLMPRSRLHPDTRIKNAAYLDEGLGRIGRVRMASRAYQRQETRVPPLP